MLSRSIFGGTHVGPVDERFWKDGRCPAAVGRLDDIAVTELLPFLFTRVYSGSPGSDAISQAGVGCSAGSELRVVEHPDSHWTRYACTVRSTPSRPSPISGAYVIRLRRAANRAEHIYDAAGGSGKACSLRMAIGLSMVLDRELANVPYFLPAIGAIAFDTARIERLLRERV